MTSSTATLPSELPGAQVARAIGLLDYQTDAVVRREIVKKATGSVTLLAFDEGQKLPEHTAPVDALVQVLDGEAEITVSGDRHLLRAGEVILVPANELHAVRALKQFKMMLTKM